MKTSLPCRECVAAILLVSALSIISACASTSADVDNCYSADVTSGKLSNGTCDFSGFLVTSGGTMLMIEEYAPEKVRACLENDCLSASYWVDDVRRVPYNACEPTKVSGTAKFKYMPDGYALIGNFDPPLSPDTVACNFPLGFYLDSDK